MQVPLTPKQHLAMAALKEHAIKDKEKPESIHYVSFDPGKITGYALFSENGTPVGMGHIGGWSKGVRGFLDRFNTRPPKVVIYEEYQIRGRAQNVDENAIATRAVIKAIKDYATVWESQLVKQQAAILPIAVKFSGMEMPRDHSLSHQISAFNHGWYRLTEEKVVIPRILWPEG